MKEVTKCLQNKTDCFALSDNKKVTWMEKGNCMILDNTAFNKPCPFYKAMKEYEADLKLYPFIKPTNKSPYTDQRRGT